MYLPVSANLLRIERGITQRSQMKEERVVICGNRNGAGHVERRGSECAICEGSGRLMKVTEYHRVAP